MSLTSLPRDSSGTPVHVEGNEHTVFVAFSCPLRAGLVTEMSLPAHLSNPQDQSFLQPLEDALHSAICGSSVIIKAAQLFDKQRGQSALTL